MRKTLALLCVFSVIVIGGVAFADDPDGDLQLARDKVAQIASLAGEVDALLAQEQAKPPFVTTVTETVTTTVTETVTTPPTTPPPTTPPPTTPPPTGCTGIGVPPGSGLRSAIQSAPAGSTFCLSAGTYTVNATIDLDSDRVIGAGMNATHIDGSGVPLDDTNRGHIFDNKGSSYFQDVDVFGASAPAPGTATGAKYGKAFINSGSSLQFQNVKCHDNEGVCVGEAGNVVADNLDCYNNGSAYSMTSGFAYAACIKTAASYNSAFGDVTMTNSFIHDQPGNGLWCDYCKYADWDIRSTVFRANGNHAIQWEMSGNWTCCQAGAVVSGNTFIGNGTNLAKFAPGGMIISTSANITVEGNTFDGTNTNAITIIYSNGRIDAQNFPASRNVIVRNNTLNGDPLVGCSLSGVTCTGNA